MTGDSHERARRLLDALEVEGVCEADQTWVQEHLSGCGDCSSYAESIRYAVSAIRTASVEFNPDLVEATSRRILIRTHELHEHEARIRALWLSCALSWVFGVISAPLLWRALEWIGQELAFPPPARIAAFVFLWIVPPALVAAALTWRRSRVAGQNGFASMQH